MIDLMIVGSQKCGTSSLKEYLGSHPEVRAHYTAEFSFFLKDEEFRAGWDEAEKRHFEDVTQPAKTVAKSVGLCLSAEGIARLHQHNPDCHVVLLVREPVSRAYSSYLMEVSYGRRLKPFTEVVGDVLSDPESRLYRTFIAYGRYAEQVQLLQRYFPAERIHVFGIDDLKTDPLSVCNHLYEALGVQRLEQQSFRIHNKGRRERFHAASVVLATLRKESNPIKRIARTLLPPQVVTRVGKWLRELNREDTPPPPLPKTAKRKLREFYEPEIDRFAELTGFDVSAWR